MPNPGDPQLAELLQLFADDALTADQAKRLNEMLRKDSVNRNAFVEYCIHAQLLRELLSPKEPPVLGKSPISKSNRRKLPVWLIPTSVAASLAVCLMVAFVAWRFIRSDPSVAVNENPPAIEDTGPINPPEQREPGQQPQT